MALTDLMTEISRNKDSFGTDDATEHSTVETVLGLMNDMNGEVKNLAVKACAALSLLCTASLIDDDADWPLWSSKCRSIGSKPSSTSSSTLPLPKTKASETSPV